MISKKDAINLVIKIVYDDHPFIIDAYGIKRFKSDPIICYLYESGQLDLNKICLDWQMGNITKENARHILRSLGYSECGIWDCAINSTTNLIKELGVDVVGQYYGWDHLKQHYEGLNQKNLIDLIGLENIKIINEQNK